MRSTSLLALLTITACSGGTTDSAQPARAPSTAVAAPARTETLASEHPFGCTLATVADGRVLWPAFDGAIAEYSAAHEADPEPAWVPLPATLALAAPAASRAVVLTAAGVCEATLGAPELHTVFEYDTADVGRPISGCPSDVGFALLCPEGVTVPSELRFARFTFGEVSVIDAATADPRLASAYRGRAFHDEHDPAECEVVGHTEVVRARTAEVSVGSEHLALVELARAWFPAGTDPSTGCPDFETLQASVDREDRVASGYDFAGVLHDGTHVLALVELGEESDPSCEGANTCTFAALDTPVRYGTSFVRRSHAVASLGSGEFTHGSSAMITNHRDGCESD